MSDLSLVLPPTRSSGEPGHIADSNLLREALSTVETYVGGRGYNIKSFGALGDGVTDDSSAIQAALDSIENDGGGLLYMPEGVYIIGTPLVVPSWVPFVMRGAGWRTILKAGASAGLAAVITDAGTTARVWQTVFEDFAIDGNVVNGNAAVNGIYVCGHTVTVSRIFAYNCFIGINLNRVPSDDSNYWGASHILNALATDCDNQGFQIAVDTIVANCRVGPVGVRTGYAEAWATCGIYVASWDCRIIGNHIWGINGPCIWANYVEHLGIHDNVMEKSYGSYIYLRGRAYLANITGNVFEDKTADGGHEALDWTDVPFIDVAPDAGQKQALLVSNNMFSELLGKPRGFCIRENAETDFGLYTGNVACISDDSGASSAFADILGANSIASNNLVRGLA